MRRMRFALKKDISRKHLRSTVEKRPFDDFTESRGDDSSHQGRLCFSPACSYAPRKTGIQSQKRVLVQPRPSSTETATRAYLERHHWYEPQERRFVFQSMRLASDETVGAYMGIRGAGNPLHV
jgi:hypothetical protein